MKRRIFSAIRIFGIALALSFGSAQARAERSFAFLSEHDPEKIIYALRYGADVVRNNGEFKLFLGGGRSVLMFVPVYRNAALVHRAYRDIRARAPRLQVIACREVVERVRAAVRAPSIPFLPGVSTVACKDLKRRLLAEGWTPALGL